jgi:hypothetical protein
MLVADGTALAMRKPAPRHPFTRESLMMVASCTKGATATCVLMLADAGVLDLDSLRPKRWRGDLRRPGAPLWGARKVDRATRRGAADRGLAAPARIGESMSMNGAFASVIGEAWGSLAERRFLLLTLIGFVCAFGFIRLSTRLMRSPRVPWWPGSVVSEGGVHVHHLFFGIVLMMVAGGLSFAAGETNGPWYAIYAVLFGIALGLTIDEYALWLHLDDVYWSREGRSSIDATLIALALICFVLLAFVPTRIDDDSPAVLATTVMAATWHFGWVLIAAAKYRLVHALFGIFVPGLAVYAGLRLAKPRSIWAKRFYGERRRAKQARAEHRFRAGRRTDRYKDRLRDAIGGVTEEEYQARLAAAAPAPRSTTGVSAPRRSPSSR